MTCTKNPEADTDTNYAWRFQGSFACGCIENSGSELIQATTTYLLTYACLLVWEFVPSTLHYHDRRNELSQLLYFIATNLTLGHILSPHTDH